MNTSISILIDPDAFLSYVFPKIVDEYKLGEVKNDKTWLVQLATCTKIKVSEIVKECEVNLNGFPTKVNLNILPLGSFVCSKRRVHSVQHPHGISSGTLLEAPGISKGDIRRQETLFLA